MEQPDSHCIRSRFENAINIKTGPLFSKRLPLSLVQLGDVLHHVQYAEPSEAAYR